MASKKPDLSDLLGGPFDRFRVAVETEYFRDIMDRAGCNKAQAAKMAGMEYTRFCRKVDVLGLRVVTTSRVVVDA